MKKQLSAAAKRKRNQRIMFLALLAVVIVAVAVASVALLFNRGAMNPSDDSSESLSISSESSEPESSKPESSSEEESSSEPESKPESSKPESSKPESSKPESSKPESSKPASKPQSSEASKPSSGKPSAYFDDAVFVGDSLTVGFGLYGVVPSENVYADVGLNPDTILSKKVVQTPNGMATVLDALKLKKPGKVYIMLGANGIAWTSPKTLSQKYETFLTKVVEALPDATIYVEGVLHVTAAKQQKDPRFANDIIDEYNGYLKQLAAKHGAVYLDTNSAMSGSDGCLSLDYAEQDGMHLKKAGYVALLDFFGKNIA